MKNLLVFACLCCLNSIIAQPYLPMLEPDHEWSVDLYFYPFDPPGPPYFWTITEQITLGGTVIIDGREYTQVLRDGDPSCLLREENGFVYKYDLNANVDRVLFDFNLMTGDTFDLTGSAYEDYMYCTGIFSTLYESILTVENVQILQIAGAMRKVITFEYAGGKSGDFQWIEGIGNITGFDLLWEALDITEGSALVCFTTDATTYFFNGATACDNTTLNVNENLQMPVVLVPNPVIDISILQFPSELNIDVIRIYDISGKLISEEPVTTHHIIIDGLDYASGLYFYQVISENNVIKTDRFVVN